MASNASKGTYQRTKTRKWLEDEWGVDVEIAERQQRIPLIDKETGEPKTIYKKLDMWGADLIFRNEDRIGLVQVKTNPSDLSRGLKELTRGRCPPWVERLVVYWPARRRASIGPEILEVESTTIHCPVCGATGVKLIRDDEGDLTFRCPVVICVAGG